MRGHKRYAVHLPKDLGRKCIQADVAKTGVFGCHTEMVRAVEQIGGRGYGAVGPREQKIGVAVPIAAVVQFDSRDSLNGISLVGELIPQY